MLQKLFLLLLAVFFISFKNVASGRDVKVKLPAIFSDNMVLQRNTSIPIWGTSAPNQIVRVELDGKTTSTNADQDGNWKVYLPALKPGGPYELVVMGKNKIIFKNVMIGDVWICSGQSNMQMMMEEIRNNFDNKKEIAAAGNYNLRIFSVDQATAVSPQNDFNATGWQICDSNTVKKFSAVAYYFGKYISEKIKVPIGLINSSFGGTDIEAWTSAVSLQKIKRFEPILSDLKKYSDGDTSSAKKYEEERYEWKSSSNHSDPGFPKKGVTWKDFEFDDSGWEKMNVPGLWDQKELVNFDGAVWYRKEINVPSSWGGRDLILNLGPIDDIDVTWFNGVELGSGERWNKPRRYIVPALSVKPGKNIIAVRCIDTGAPGGMWGEANQYSISVNSNDSISLAGEWLYKRSLALSEFPPKPVSFDDPNFPTVLFNAMIAPLIPYAIRGTIWYQGENNTSNALEYRTLFPLMIQDWRSKWKQGNFPFFFVQLANYMRVISEPVEDTWAELRESQLMTLKVENTGMASAIDIGDSADIHPKNKREVGRRLSLIALNKVYGFKNTYSGPLYSSFHIKGDKIIIDFDFADGLTIKDGAILKGFAIAGNDHKFQWAHAKIIGKSVMVWNTNITNPVAVRYAWASNPVCNLYNSVGLPASPFRTDSWEVLTKDFQK